MVQTCNFSNKAIIYLLWVFFCQLERSLVRSVVSGKMFGPDWNPNISSMENFIFMMVILGLWWINPIPDIASDWFPSRQPMIKLTNLSFTGNKDKIIVWEMISDIEIMILPSFSDYVCICLVSAYNFLSPYVICYI